MRRLHELIDVRGVVCYLECVGDKNRAFYEQLGRQRKREKTMTSPSDGTRTLVENTMVQDLTSAWRTNTVELS